MASLWSLFNKQKVHPESLRFFAAAYLALRDNPPKLVDISFFVRQCLENEAVLCASSLDVTPCHRHLWIEYCVDGPRQAILVTRTSVAEISRRPDRAKAQYAYGIPPENARHHVQLSAWIERDASVCVYGHGKTFIDQLGQLIDPDHSALREGFQERMKAQMSLVFEVLTIMNTRGTRIEPPLEKHCEVVKPNRRPHSVWHTIHLPKFQAPPLENAIIDGPVLERREHWVRAHRKDYRQGAGMFGRVKALVWVPEHQRGNPELGTVKQSFKVHPREHR